MTRDFDIEVETGLKKDLAEIEEKLANVTKKYMLLCLMKWLKSDIKNYPT
jgi:hypothetical protein